MNIKFYGFAALFATICCAQNAVAFDTPHGWKMMQTRDAITYEPADADSHETSVIIAPPFPAKGMNAVATLKDMAESADAFSLEDSDGIHKKGARVFYPKAPFRIFAEFIDFFFYTFSKLLNNIFQHDGFYLRHFVERGHDAFSTDAAVLPPAEGHFKRAVKTRAVDNRFACFHRVCDFKRAFLIA